jgi:hypothetical protein
MRRELVSFLVPELARERAILNDSPAESGFSLSIGYMYQARNRTSSAIGPWPLLDLGALK